MTAFTFEAFDLTSGAYVAPMPDILKPQVTFQYSDLGAVKFSYPKAGRYATTIYNQALTGLEVVTYYNGVEIDDGRYVVQVVQGSQVDEDSPNWEFTGISFADVLRKVIVYSNTTFTNKSAGEIVKTLLTTASGRGAFGATAISTSTFSNTTDSNSATWTTLYNMKFDVGTTYRQVLERLSSAGAIDFKFVGRSLRLYKGGTLGTAKDITITPQTGLSETPVKYSLVDQANVVLVEGDGGVTLERNLAGARREESYLQQSGVSDSGTLTIFADSALATASVVQEQRTVKIEDGGRVQAIRDFVVGDTVLYDVQEGQPAEVMRVRQITVDIDEHGADSASVILNDRILEGEIRRAQSLGLLAGGVDVGGGGPTSEPPTVDTTVPSAPAGLTMSSTAYIDANGTPRVVVTANWGAVTTNVGGSTIEDLAGYRLYMRAEDNPASPLEPLATSTTTTVSVGGVPANVFRRFVVRAYDQSNNESADSNEYRFQTANDTTAPNTPSTPVVTPYLGQLRIFWNGLDSGGGATPPDFNRVEVHISTTTGFTPSSATKTDELRGAGYAIATDLPYATLHYVRLVAYDNAGNASSPSTQANATTERVSGLDVEALAIATTHLGDGAVTALKIADATITSAKIGTAQILNANIAALAVDDAKIASVSAGKLTVGTLTADITVSARIKTANTGARAEMSNLGFEAYNSGGTRTFFVQASTGNVSILGDFKTGVAGGGSAYLTIDDSVDRTTINFWNAAGTKNAFINSPVGASAPQLGMNTGSYTITGTTAGYSRLFLRDGGGIGLETVRASDQTAFGGAILLNSTSATIRVAPLGGADTNAAIEMSNTAIELVRNTTGTPTGGKLRVDNTAAWIEYNSAGTGQHGFQFTSTGVLQYGATRNNIAWSASPASGWSIGEFGTWKFGGLVVMHALVQRTGATITPTGTNVTPDVTCMTITGTTPSYSPTVHWGNGAVFGEALYNSDGTVNIRSASEPIVSGTNVRLGCVFWDG